MDTLHLILETLEQDQVKEGTYLKIASLLLKLNKEIRMDHYLMSILLDETDPYIKNPITGRIVLKSGKIGKKLINPRLVG